MQFTFLGREGFGGLWVDENGEEDLVRAMDMRRAGYVCTGGLDEATENVKTREIINSGYTQAA